MRAHLYEFRSDRKKLSCLCGWERTLKTVDDKQVRSAFEAHLQSLTPKP